MTDPTRQQLLDAAVRVYSEHGFRGATTRRIADEAGVNEVTLFRIFGSKAVLIEEAVRAISSSGLRARLPEVPGDPATELTAWAESEHGNMLAKRDVMRTAMAEAHSQPDCALATTEHAECGLMELRSYIERLAKHRLIPTDEIALSASAMLMGTLWADASGRDMMPTMFPPVEQAPANYVRLFLRAIGAAVVALFLLAIPYSVEAQQPTPTATLSLAEALRMAEQKSEAVRIAAAGVHRARGQQRQATSQRLPQLDAAASYTRAIQSQFQAISERFAPDTGTGGGGGIENSPLAQIFAAPNTALLQLNLSQNIYSAGRIGAAVAGADASRTAAEIGLASSRAQAALDAAQAYFDAVASEQVLAIAESSLVLTERSLAQTQLAREVGTAAEFDLLRARVARDNQRPLVIQARGNRNTAFLRLKQLLDLPLAAPLELTTPIRDDSTVVTGAMAPIELADEQSRTVAPDTSVSARASVRQAEALLDAQRSALRAAKLARLPSVRLTSTYQRFAYPPEGTFLPGALDLYFPNWTVSLGLSFPIFTGGRLSGGRMVAQADVVEAEERLRQVSEGAELDALLALNALEQAQASYLASVGTDAQAAQAYEIAEVRFREGISTQLELTETRVQLEQARLQRVTAARDLEIAKLRLALLKDLPLTPPGMVLP